MNAVVRSARDVGPVREMIVPVDMQGHLVIATVKFQVSYQSLWHRTFSWQPEIDVIAATHEVGTEVRQLPMRRDLHDAICDVIEANELELN